MVRASAVGPNGARLFDFSVDTGSTFVGLPMADIEALGLPMVHDGRHIHLSGLTSCRAFAFSIYRHSNLHDLRLNEIIVR